jgi:hypothetical protein
MYSIDQFINLFLFSLQFFGGFTYILLKVKFKYYFQKNFFFYLICFYFTEIAHLQTLKYGLKRLLTHIFNYLVVHYYTGNLSIFKKVNMNKNELFKRHFDKAKYSNNFVDSLVLNYSVIPLKLLIHHNNDKPRILLWPF